MPFFSDTVLGLPIDTIVSDRVSSAVPIEQEVVELFDELRGRLLRYLLYTGLSEHDSEDIIQETFLLLFQHLQRGKSRDNLRGWIFGVSRNLALKRRAANGRNRDNVECDSTFADQCRDLNPNPEEVTAASQRQRQLLAVARALPERDQSCLHLRAEGLKYREIARALGLSLGSVAASIARSLTRLSRADRG